MKKISIFEESGGGENELEKVEEGRRKGGVREGVHFRILAAG